MSLGGRPARLVSACLAPVGWGVAAGVVTPRGPLTPVAALAAIGLGLAVGGVAGYLARTRWAMLGAPVLFAVVFELVRIGATGPSVDLPRLGVFGVLALVSGRGAHGLLGLLPMFVGAAYGAGLARRSARADGAPPREGRIRRYLGRTVIGLLAAVVVLLAAGVAAPASTAPVAGGRGVAELTTVESGGRRLGLMIRGADTSNPVLLFVPGAPGASERGAVRARLSGLERHFVVATLDRRGGGASQAAIEPTGTFTPESETADALAAANHLRTRFRRDRVYLLAHSGGTLPAVLAVQRRPDLFHAYIGVGQAVNTGAADRVQYTDTLAWARKHDAALDAALRAAGPPPYDSIHGYEPMLLAEPRVYAPPGHEPTTQGGLDESLAAPEYSLLEKMRLFAGFLDAYDVYYPRARDVDLRQRVPRLAVPAYFVDGAAEVPARLALMEDWYGRLSAPVKRHLILPGAGHRSMYDQPAAFVDTLVKHVLHP
ncbi:alpha/beta fold hydrolase [Bailinhaonella thermotolerans]|uniref:Alpha/beta hydrolase n=1 Tax=Bailinhaonella thermotolerans TaxID=1070861 RepID=A0A3A4ACE1_9ACTN|nr:alpha/beta hydrolase [Bailinhaonella thermotolerans]RJL24457.1 alpha/beta hydrolase [Bailinhaonella thermotolerans]